MRCWVKSHPVKPQAEETPGTVILKKEPALQANFARVHSALSRAQVSGVPRYLPNPEPQWGPKPRAGRTLGPKHMASHRPPEGQLLTKKGEREGEHEQEENDEQGRETKRVRLGTEEAFGE
eukprot:TRINITY_DN3912_c0_g4_i1.p1 TRINITY_DN3912_c0_g4~~TRINITY_DN3912_c0_g4_i1.p1  ORF type:complete len:121 (+),score=16.37 TRINITY_DN3912_c0_g4_i1:2-364(+)